MQQLSRLSAVTLKPCRAFSFAHNNRFFHNESAAAVPTGKPRPHEFYSSQPDDGHQFAVHHGMPEETQELYEPESSKPDRASQSKEGKESEETELVSPPRPLYASPPKLEKTEVANPAEPYTQRKRRNSTSALEQVSCAGLDGSPWPKRESQREQQEESDAEYYSRHKASPLSEIEVEDSRKPITRAIDGTAYSQDYGANVIGWRPEQLDTAEEALERARRIFRENAMRGDPDSPHGRVLRLLRGEWF